jgi:two-component system response regulator PilR (NtrC family)
MKDHRRILIVEDDGLLREQMSLSLRQQYTVAEAGDPEAALAQLAQQPTDLVLLDLQLRLNGTTEDGFSVLRELRRRASDVVVIVMTGDPHYETRMRAIEEGAYDCFTKPFDIHELELVLRRSLERLDLQRENRRLKEQVVRQFSFQNLIGCSPTMMRVFETIQRFADSPATVLLLGESGTGKELVARALHFQSSRRDAPFVAVHCSALPETLIETELFGHEKGAFTGAVAAHQGRFELAHGGTLFLDEVSTLNLNVQTKLLRVLEERQFERVGGRKTIQVDVRLIAASNEDLESLVPQGRFREDLFFRLNVLPLRLPPLRERKEDIPLLVNHFIRQFAEQGKLAVKSVAAEALNHLLAHSWKGNVRELENVIQRAVLMADGDTIRTEHLPPHIAGSMGPVAAGLRALPPEGLDLAAEVARYEQELIRAALNRTRGVKTDAAKLLHLSREQMKYLCRKYELEGKFSPEG